MLPLGRGGGICPFSNVLMKHHVSEIGSASVSRKGKRLIWWTVTQSFATENVSEVVMVTYIKVIHNKLKRCH
jgi:hypothetical protein